MVFFLPREGRVTSGRLSWFYHNLCSNGVIELENGFNEQFGIERLINLVINNRDLLASEILNVAKNALSDYSHEKPASSDVTLIILQRS